MAYRVFVQEEDPLTRLVTMYIVQDSNYVQHLYTPRGSVVQRTEEAVVTPKADLDDAAWRIPREALREMYATLGTYLGAVESPAALRKDYDEERARVDKFIDVLLSPQRSVVDLLNERNR